MVKIPPFFSSPRHSDQEIPLGICACLEYRLIPRGQPFRDLAVLIECRSVAVAKKGMVWFRSEQAVAMRAERREGKEPALLSNHEKPSVR